MASCPCCFGEGGYDDRDFNAFLGEHLTDAELAPFLPHEDWLVCVECEGTGVVSDERAAELDAEARERVGEIMAEIERLDEAGLRG